MAVANTTFLQESNFGFIQTNCDTITLLKHDKDSFENISCIFKIKPLCKIKKLLHGYLTNYPTHVIFSVFN